MTTVRGTRTQRKALLIAHIVSSVAWLGVSLGMLTLGLAGRFTGGRRTVEGAYWAAHVFVDVLVIPLAVVSLVTGLWLGLVTHWGLVRQKWVLTKLVLTLITFMLSLLLLRPGVMEAYHNSGSGGDPAKLRDAGGGLVAAGIVSSSTYLFMTIVSVFKPWGATRWGRRR